MSLYPLGKVVTLAERSYEEVWLGSPYGNLEVFNQLWAAASEATRRNLLDRGKMSAESKVHSVDMQKLLALQTPGDCTLFAVKVVGEMKMDGRLAVRYLDTGSHGAAVVHNYALIDSSAAEVIKLWRRKGSFVNWREDSEKGTLWHRASRMGKGIGWYQSEIVQEVCGSFRSIVVMLGH
jgi:hypothetical protein